MDFFWELSRPEYLLGVDRAGNGSIVRIGHLFQVLLAVIIRWTLLGEIILTGI
jgi:hypothetical protein